MQQLKDTDIAELDEWVQARHIHIARKSLDANCSQAERDETLRLAMLQAQDMTWMSGRGAKMIATPAGMARLVWQCVHRNHPGVTEEEIAGHMFDPNNIDSAVNVDAANDAFKKLNVRKKTPKKTKKQRKRKKKKRTHGRQSTKR
jgi:hypothetical protein